MTPASARSIIRPLAGAAFAAGVLAVVVLSLVPQEALSHFNLSDKPLHAAAYLCLALAGGIAFPDRRSLLALALGLVALGIVLEFGQALVPGRFTSVGDAVANTVGVVLGLTIARFAVPWIRSSA